MGSLYLSCTTYIGYRRPAYGYHPYSVKGPLCNGMEWGSQASLQNLPRVGTLGKDLDNYLGIFSNYIILSSSAQIEWIKKKAYSRQISSGSVVA